MLKQKNKELGEERRLDYLGFLLPLLSLIWLVVWILGQAAYRSWLDIDFFTVMRMNCGAVATFLLLSAIWFWRLIVRRNQLKWSDLFWMLAVPVMVIGLWATSLVPTRHEIVFRQHRDVFEAIATGEIAASPENLAALSPPFTEKVTFYDSDVTFFGDGWINAIYSPSSEIAYSVHCRIRGWYLIFRQIDDHWFICMKDWSQ